MTLRLHTLQNRFRMQSSIHTIKAILSNLLICLKRRGIHILPVSVLQSDLSSSMEIAWQSQLDMMDTTVSLYYCAYIDTGDNCTSFSSGLSCNSSTANTNLRLSASQGWHESNIGHSRLMMELGSLGTFITFEYINDFLRTSISNRKE